ncbi:hypothetical protein [Neogemmobacter tilapiae]|uniref:Uncharacterized protein n=1 Tax=Neogemmobacter tilapiae TaxID=875041 RepID=A0A918TYB0_9RHOB|nr:hypothetical protein [Gemmobacter tilapiae]GHC65702.1 hypothetical protein GCM10007315_32820 [Gemmobacter tilapiae]
MFRSLERQFQRRAELLMMGRHAALARHCQFPFQMQLADRMLLVHSPEEYAQLMGRLRDNLLDRGVQVLLAEVSAVEMPKAGMFRVWVTWEAMTSATEEVEASLAIYHGVLQEGQFLTDRVEFMSAQMTELMALSPQLAKSA